MNLELLNQSNQSNQSTQSNTYLVENIFQNFFVENRKSSFESESLTQIKYKSSKTNDKTMKGSVKSFETMINTNEADVENDDFSIKSESFLEFSNEKANSLHETEESSSSKEKEKEKLFQIQKTRRSLLDLNRKSLKNKKVELKKQANREAVKKFREKQKVVHETLQQENLLLKKRLNEMNQLENKLREAYINKEEFLRTFIKNISTKEFLKFMTEECLERVYDKNFLVQKFKEKIQNVSFNQNAKNLIIFQKVINLIDSVDELICLFS